MPILDEVRSFKSHVTGSVLVSALACFAAANSAQAAAINPGNLVIYRVGDGSAALSTAATSVFLDEYTVGGTLVQSLVVPSTGTAAMTAVGNATTEGIISLAGDGSKLIFTGYKKAAGGTNPSSDAPATTPRVIGSVNLFGTVDTSLTLSDPTGTIRSAATANGSSYYLGTSTSVRYVTDFASGTTVQIDARNSRQVLLSGSTLYAANGSTAVTAKLQSYGSSPTGATTPTPIITLGSGDAINGFALFDLNPSIAGDDTLYALSTVTSTLLKYTYDGSTWNANGSISASSAQNIVGSLNGTTVSLFLTSGTTLFSFTDASGYGGTETGSLTTLAAAGLNTAFRGVGMLPQVVPEPSTLSLAFVGAGLLLAFRRRHR